MLMAAYSVRREAWRYRIRFIFPNEKGREPLEEQ